MTAAIIDNHYEFHGGCILVYTDTQNFWVLTRTDTVSLYYECL